MNETLDRPCCGNCQFFTPPPPKGNKGLCIRFPQSIEKAAERLCGEHPRFKDLNTEAPHGDDTRDADAP